MKLCSKVVFWQCLMNEGLSSLSGFSRRIRCDDPVAVLRACPISRSHERQLPNPYRSAFKNVKGSLVKTIPLDFFQSLQTSCYQLLFIRTPVTTQANRQVMRAGET